MKAYRKRPHLVHAAQFDGTPMMGVEKVLADGVGIVHTQSGPVTIRPGDYLVRGIRGQYSAVVADVFHETYELVEVEHGE